MQSNIQQNLYVGGTLTCKSFVCPAGAISDNSIQAGSNIDAAKLMHRFNVPLIWRDGTAVTDWTSSVHTVYGATGTLIALSVTPITPPTSSDTISIDLKLGNAGAAFATVLTAPILLNSSSVPKTPVYASFASTDLESEDILQLVVDVTGSTPQGLVVMLVLEEEPNT